ncbi:MAG: accessory gene regulator B family protein [Clostridia bacterium]|nr:accessory gene regulator B family protein [Clostridia bacterium]
MLKLDLTGPAATYLREKLGLSAADEEVVRYGLQVVVYTAAGFASISLAGWLVGALPTTLAAALSAGALRLFSGGAHSRSPLTCNLLGAAMACLVGKAAAVAAALFVPPILLLVLLAPFIPATVAVWRLAPVDSPAKPITSPGRRRKLRRLSLAALLTLTVGQMVLLPRWPALAMAVGCGTWWQAFTLTRAGHRFAAVLDNFTRKG